MATARRQPSDQPKARSLTYLTLADTYGLGLIAADIEGAHDREMFAYLSPAAKKIARSLTKQSTTKQSAKKKSASTRRVAMKR